MDDCNFEVSGISINNGYAVTMVICVLLRCVTQQSMIVIGYVYVQSCLLIVFQYRAISSNYQLEQPIRFRLSVVYASLGISNTIKDNSNDNMP